MKMLCAKEEIFGPVAGVLKWVNTVHVFQIKIGLIIFAKNFCNNEQMEELKN